MFSCLCHCQQVEVIPGRDRADFSRGASEGHPEGAALWVSSPLFTPADPACWAYGSTSPLFLVLCSRGGHITQCRESCRTQPGLFHQPKAAWTETESASKQSTHLFTANYFPESWPSRTTWRTCHIYTHLYVHIRGGMQATSPTHNFF